MRFLPNICGHHALLPKSLSTSYSYDLTGTLPHDSGGYADVWKGQYHDQVVALKVARAYLGFELVKTRHVGYHRPSVSINKLTASHTRRSARRLLYGRPFTTQMYCRC